MIAWLLRLIFGHPHVLGNCQSCSAPAEVLLDDGSEWCISCDCSARRLGYDNRPAKFIPRDAA